MPLVPRTVRPGVRSECSTRCIPQSVPRSRPWCGAAPACLVHRLDKVDSTAYDHPALVGLAKTCAPGNDTVPAGIPCRLAYHAGVAAGLVMTPMSSLLEASNAGHMNPESTPSHRRLSTLIIATISTVTATSTISTLVATDCALPLPSVYVWRQTLRRSTLGFRWAHPAGMATRWIRGYGFRCVREVQALPAHAPTR